MLDLLRPTYDSNLEQVQKLVADVPDEKMCDQPVPGSVMNHAAFLLGHLAWGSDLGLRWLGSEQAMSAEWQALFAMSSQPLADRSSYPSKDSLLKELDASHARLKAALSKATPEFLTKPAPEKIRDRYPTLSHTLVGLMISHEAGHVGQLSAWRRAMGFAPVPR